MKLKVYLIFFLYATICFKGRAQNIETVYFVPGQGSDKRIFDSLLLDEQYKIKFLEYDTISKKISLKELAGQLTSAIDTTENFALIGVSLGGMLSVEMSEIVQPTKVILISSAKNKKELPFRYRFQKVIPLYGLFPAKTIAWGAKTLQPIVEPDRDSNEETFKSMLSKKKPKYLKRTIRMIIKWKRKTNNTEIVHIHGTNDHTLPYRKINNPKYTIENGSHMMVLTRAKEVSLLLENELNDL